MIGLLPEPLCALNEESEACFDKIETLSKTLRPDSDRDFSDEFVTSLLATNLLQFLNSKNSNAFGGTWFQLLEFLRRVSQLDTSLSWVVGLSIAHRELFHSLYPALAINNNTIVATASGPIECDIFTTESGEGFVISGKWKYSGFAKHADWFIFSVTAKDFEIGEPTSLKVAIQAADVVIRDVIPTTGLKSASPYQVELLDAHVERTQCYFGAPLVRFGESARDLPYSPFIGSLILGSLFGTAETIVSEFAGRAKKSVCPRTGVKLDKLETTRFILASASSKLHAAHALFKATGLFFETHNTSPQKFNHRSQLNLKRDRVQIGQLCFEAASICLRACSTSAYVEGSRIYRAWADLQMLLSHVDLNWGGNMSLIGEAILEEH